MIGNPYPRFRSTFREKFNLDLTAAQIERYRDRHPVLKTDIPEDVCDTISRHLLIDFIVADVMGSNFHWPLVGDNETYKNVFYRRFPERAVERGFKLVQPFPEV